MDKKTRTIIIIGGIITFLVVPVVATLIFSQANKPATEETTDVTTPPLANRSNDELAKAIAQNQPDNLADENGNPNFVISSVKKPQDGWYIVTMHFKYDTEATNPAKILLYDQGEAGGLNVIIGPGTSFTSEETDPLGIPDSIAKELNK